MFTGLVQSLGTLLSAHPTPAGKRFTIALNQIAHHRIEPGDSICISGVCLTVVTKQNDQATFDVITETLNRTTLGSKKTNDQLNLELSLRPDSYLGGHFVQGHIDAIAKVTHIQSDPNDYRITFTPTPETLPFIIPKGSITVDGVSMTIASTTPTTFTLAIIPTTLTHTTLGTLRTNDPINIETDILTRSVIHYLQNFTQPEKQKPETHSPLTLEKLRSAGFL